MFHVDYRISTLFVFILSYVSCNHVSLGEKEANDTNPIVLNWRFNNKFPVVDVNIGTPPQKFLLWLIIDAPYLMVIDKDYLPTESNVKVKPTNYYDASLSTTSHLQNLTFNSVEDGIGKLYQDSVEVSGLRFQQSFVAMYKDIKRWGDGSDGILGLGYGQSTNSLFYNLINTRKSKWIMIKIDNDTNLLENNSKGSLIIGSPIPNNTQINYVTSLSSSSWRFGIKCAWVGVVQGKKFQETNDIGTIWVGSSYTKGPRTIVNLVYRAISAVPFGENQHYVFKSKVNKIPSIHFELVDGFKFSMKAEDMLFEENDTLSYQLTGYHDVRIFALKVGLTSDSSDPPSWYFGEHFIKRYPILLDGNSPQKIGFVGLKSGKSGIILSYTSLIIMIVLYFI